MKRVTEESGGIAVGIAASKRLQPLCSSCGRKMPGYNTLRERSWRHVSLWEMPVTHCKRRR